MLSWLKRQQDRDGGFNYATAGGASDVDDTGAVLEALAGSGGPGIARAVRFIESQQDRDGGFPSSQGSGSNAQSTAWAVQGLIAAGSGGSPVHRALGYLSSLIAPDGHVRYSRGVDQTPVWVTAEALMALDRKPLPLAPVELPVRHRRHRSSHPRRRREIRHTTTPRSSAAPLGLADALATYAGVADALALAPIGIG
jgi:hypothetical protein